MAESGLSNWADANRVVLVAGRSAADRRRVARWKCGAQRLEWQRCVCSIADAGPARLDGTSSTAEFQRPVERAAWRQPADMAPARKRGSFRANAFTLEIGRTRGASTGIACRCPSACHRVDYHASRRARYNSARIPRRLLGTCAASSRLSRCLAGRNLKGSGGSGLSGCLVS